MQTFLGRNHNLSENDIIESFQKCKHALFIEGYLWSSESARKALKRFQIAKTLNKSNFFIIRSSASKIF